MSRPDCGHFQEPGECSESFHSGPLLRNVLQLAQPELKPEFVRRLHGARVVMAHYELLRHDFPQLRSASLANQFPGIAPLSGPWRRRLEKRLIDRWLLKNAALMSECQVGQIVANSPIAVGEKRFPVFRPPNYGRAVVSSLLQMRRIRGQPEGPRGLLDLKGTGMAPGNEPTPVGHRTGLLFLGQALSDMVFEELLTRLFEHAEAPFQTLPTYALISCGFDARFQDGSLSPACIQVRRAHRRARGGGDIPRRGSVWQQTKLEVEMLLRRYGVTSCTSGTSVHFRKRNDQLEVRIGNVGWTELNKAAQRGLPFLPGWRPDRHRYDGINVQTTITVGDEDPRAILVDFGHYTVPGRFEFPVLSLVTDSPLRWGGAQAEIAQPQAELVPDLDTWGPYPPEASEQPPNGPWTRTQVRGFELARAWEAGKASGRELRQELDDMLGAGTGTWTKNGRDKNGIRNGKT